MSLSLLRTKVKNTRNILATYVKTKLRDGPGTCTCHVQMLQVILANVQCQVQFVPVRVDGNFYRTSTSIYIGHSKCTHNAVKRLRSTRKTGLFPDNLGRRINVVFLFCDLNQNVILACHISSAD